MSARARRMIATQETASCLQVMRTLQSYLDGEVDELTARRVASHLDVCRRCGLEASVYREMKAALSRQGEPVSSESLERLRRFSSSLLQGNADGEGPTDQDLPPG
ncbi:MAG: zf-HC2 domain-containing protein [Actinomycetota bacterium]|nr:zf-HC2 domain-containing protein [Actinomycetota bacterium]